MALPDNVDFVRFTNNRAVLLRFEDGQPALWLERTRAKHEDGFDYTINDTECSYFFSGPSQSLISEVESWKESVGWDVIAQDVAK